MPNQPLNYNLLLSQWFFPIIAEQEQDNQPFFIE